MQKDTLTKLNMKELNASEYSAIRGGGVIDHLRCVRSSYMNSPVKTLLLGTTIWGMARSIGIMVGCSGA